MPGLTPPPAICLDRLPGGAAFVSLAKAEAQGLGPFTSLPASLAILAEDSLRHGDEAGARAIAGRDRAATIRFHPGRILMQDSSGVPVLADLAALRDAVALGTRVEPGIPVDLVVDHSVEVDRHGTRDALVANLGIEFARNQERYHFLRWAEGAFETLRVVPPGRGICHQINLEVLAEVVCLRDGLARPDTMLGTDSHSTMVNALGVLGWGVGGIEALSAMLGRAVALRVPEVLGVNLVGRLPPGSTATDLALALTATLRRYGVVQKIVEFFGPGLSALRLPDRASIANMAPEYGATMGFFPVDAETLAYLRLTGRTTAQIALIETYAQVQGLWHHPEGRHFDAVLTFDLAQVEPCVAGPSRPDQTLALSAVAASYPAPRRTAQATAAAPIRDGDIAIAAITSCTNTANTDAMLRAGLLARAARERGLTARPWIKASLAPGSRVMSDHLARTGLLADLETLGFSLVGHGCTTCMGNSGPLAPEIEQAVRQDDLTVAAVLSGNRNFEGRIHPLVRAAYLASPPLVVAYALAGSMLRDLTREPVGLDDRGRPVMLAEIWPDDEAVAAAAAALGRDNYVAGAATTFDGPEAWSAIPQEPGERFPWRADSQFIRPPPFASGAMALPLLDGDLLGGRILALLGDDVTTDHISPIARIPLDSEAGAWLIGQGETGASLQSYSARRVNHDVMARGTFANLRLRNRLVPEREGGYTRLEREGPILTIHEAAERLGRSGMPAIVIAGRNYGAGSARDWAAKGTRILGIAAVIAESFERIHRSNLVALGVLPLQFQAGTSAASLGLDGFETIDLLGLDGLQPAATVRARFHKPDGRQAVALLSCRIETLEEAQDLLKGGVLPTVLHRLQSATAACS